jgi:hypothetical protein
MASDQCQGFVILRSPRLPCRPHQPFVLCRIGSRDGREIAPSEKIVYGYGLPFHFPATLISDHCSESEQKPIDVAYTWGACS